MKITAILCAAVLAAMLSAATEEKDPFPPFDTLKSSVLMRPEAEITISSEGHFLADGVPRYLEGTIYYEGITESVNISTRGYPDCLKWLYENTQDYRDLQRVGFDSAGTSVPNLWIDRYRPGKNYSRYAPDEKRSERFLHSGLPVYVDFTAAPWHHGALKYQEGELPSSETFTVPGTGNNHWVPYSLSTPEGKKLWLELWTYGALFLKENGVKPLVYELFNEPDYNDWSDFSRKLFRERMKEKYDGDIGTLNRAWHTAYPDFEVVGSFKELTGNTALQVEWIKFMEDLFAEICAEGVEAIRLIDPRPEAGFCVQPLSLHAGRNLNLYKVNRHMNMVCSPTGGGHDFFTGHFLRAIADGKPIFDGETYLGHTRRSHRDGIWTQYARGFNASYVFKWSRRPHETVWKEKDGGERLKEMFPYLMLNPYGVPAEALLGLMDAKREIMAVNDLFTPRDRGIPRETALLFSYPAARYCRATGYPDLLGSYAAALEYSQFPIDFILEEQLPEGRQNRYRAIIVPGVATVLPETAAYLETFVKEGGTLILGQEAMQSDEYGFPAADGTFPGITIEGGSSGERGRFMYAGKTFTAAPYNRAGVPAGWQTPAGLNGTPVLYRKQLGDGKVFFLNARMPQEELGALLELILKEDAITPCCRITDALTGKKVSSLEVNKARRNGKTGYIIFNRAMNARFVRFTPEEDTDFCDPYGKVLLEKKGNAFLLRLAPDERVVVIGGDREVLERKFGPLAQQSYSEAEKEGLTWLAANRPAASGTAFSVDPDRIRTLDLRKAANRAFEDRIAGDGRGGWTDQGDNCLHGAPWGIRECNGVPFDFIRPDQNEERACIVLASDNLSGVSGEVRGIEVNSVAAALYFLHAGAWLSENEEGFRYIVRYADGSRAELPVRANIETGDWYHVLRKIPGMECAPGFVNSQQRGLFVWKWENPVPEKTVSTIDIISANGSMIPLIAGISIEIPAAPAEQFMPLLTKEKPVKFAASNGMKISREGDADVAIDLSRADAWASCRIELPEPFRLPDSCETGNLEFNLSSPTGNIPALQVRIEGKYHPLAPFQEDAAEGAVSVSVPLDLLTTDPHSPLSTLSFQMAGKQEGVKVTVSRLGVREAAKADHFNLRHLSFAPWGKLNVRKTREYLELNVNDESVHWCGAVLQLPAPAPVPCKGFLTFEVNGGPDSWGKQDKGGQEFQVQMRCSDAAGTELRGNFVPVAQILSGGVDADPATWQKLSIPLDRLVPEGAQRLNGIAIQFQRLPLERSGVQLRNIRMITEL